MKTKLSFNLKTISVAFIFLFIISIFFPVYNFIKSKKDLKINSGEEILSFSGELSEKEKVIRIKKALNKKDIDSNFTYTFVKHIPKLNSSSLSSCVSYAKLASFKAETFKYEELNTIISKNTNTYFTENLNGNFEKLDTKSFGHITYRWIGKINKQRKKKIKIPEFGDVTFCVEDSMKLNESYRALLIVSKSISNEFINSVLKSAFTDDVPDITKDTMLLSKKLYASLLPAISENFKIRKMDLDTVKLIDLKKDYITWEWVVTPIKAAKSNLILKLSRVETKSGDLDKFYPSKIIPVHVFATNLKYSEQIIEFVKQEWKWLLTSIVGLVGWILVYKRGK